MDKEAYYKKVIFDAFEMMIKDKPVSEVYGTPETSLQFGVFIKLSCDEIGIKKTLLILQDVLKKYG